MKKATTAALLSALLWGITGTSCALTEASGEDVQPVGDNATTITADPGVTLPAGVLPPNNPPEPGDAPLGPDGHYNYDAPEFVLTNPCDDPEIMGRLDRLGFREQTEVSERIKGVKQIGCGLQTSHILPLGLWHTSVAHSRLENYDAHPATHHSEGLHWVTFRQTNPIGLSYCIASVETPKGALGFITHISEEKSTDFDETICKPVNELMTNYLGEIS